jgi:hypothetical protein
MLNYSKLAGIAAAVVLSLMWAVPAQAQATRTWISGVGDDANPCSRTAPCKTFAGAISKTAAGGEIDCLDPGGFGAVTVTKSITLDCGGGNGGQVGSILVSGTNGVTVSAGAADLIKIRNLTINGIQKTGSPGLSGIKFNTAAALIVEHVGIFGMGGLSGSNGGIDFEPTVAGAKLYTVDVDIQYGLADGILIKPTSSGTALASIAQTSLLHNAGSGVRVDGTNVASGLSANVTVADSTASGNQFGIFAVTPVSTGTVRVMLAHDTFANNSSAGVVSNGATVTVRIGSSNASGNGTGLAQTNSGTLASYGNNQVDGNTTADTSGTIGSVSLR